MRALLSMALLSFATACGGAEPKAAGEECVATSECAEGLTCDFGQEPAVCSEQQTRGPDASTEPAIDAAPAAIDAAPIVPDAAPAPPDASPPDASPPDASPPDASPPDASA